MKEKVETEVSLLKRFDHPNIVRYYDMDWEKWKANIYMEWCEGSNLDFYVSQHYKSVITIPNFVAQEILMKSVTAKQAGHPTERRGASSTSFPLPWHTATTEYFGLKKAGYSGTRRTTKSIPGLPLCIGISRL